MIARFLRWSRLVILTGVLPFPPQWCQVYPWFNERARPTIANGLWMRLPRYRLIP